MIEVKNLTQIYKSGKGIFDVTFDVKEGEVFGYLGPNGAGKTTTIRNLMGFMNPSEGSAYINKLNCRENSATLMETIGYLPGEMNMFDTMTGNEFIKFIADMRNLKDLTKMQQLIERFELDASGLIKKMSKGMKQKLGIVVAFMHDPQVLILDEPTSGLDPLMQQVFMDLIVEEKKAGKTILMSSHIFEEVQRLCDRVAVIKDGKIVAIEDVDDLDNLNNKTFVITTEDTEKVLAFNDNAALLSKDTVKINIAYPYNDFYKLLSTIDVTNIRIEAVTLESQFMKYYGKDVN
jgi:ABC-2 type transport system ATP-binding protein